MLTKLFLYLFPEKHMWCWISTWRYEIDSQPNLDILVVSSVLVSLQAEQKTKIDVTESLILARPREANSSLRHHLLEESIGTKNHWDSTNLARATTGTNRNDRKGNKYNSNGSGSHHPGSWIMSQTGNFDSNHSLPGHKQYMSRIMRSKSFYACCSGN